MRTGLFLTAQTCREREIVSDEDGVSHVCRRILRDVLESIDPVKRKAKAFWRDGRGIEFVRRIGIGPGHAIVDFGSGQGNFTIPAAKVAGPAGNVYPVEKRPYTLRRLIKSARRLGLDNVHPVESIEQLQSILKQKVNAVLFYDVLHFFDASGRKNLYRLAREWLADDGFLSIHPVHTAGKDPERHLKDISVEDLCREIEEEGFKRHDCIEGDVWHGHGTMQSKVYNFKV